MRSAGRWIAEGWSLRHDRARAVHTHGRRLGGTHVGASSASGGGRLRIEAPAAASCQGRWTGGRAARWGAQLRGVAHDATAAATGWLSRIGFAVFGIAITVGPTGQTCTLLASSSVARRGGAAGASRAGRAISTAKLWVVQIDTESSVRHLVGWAGVLANVAATPSAGRPCCSGVTCCARRTCLSCAAAGATLATARDATIACTATNAPVPAAAGTSRVDSGVATKRSASADNTTRAGCACPDVVQSAS